MSFSYYNELDKKAAAWLRELIKVGAIAPGVVDERSIEDVRPGDLAGFTQCHFFAGIGIWSHALRLAGWPDDRPVWTGSCPCQPFSQAGEGVGFADERHLWPAWFQLIAQCRPGVVYGEQVASKDGLGWLDLVHADLEAADYAVGAVDLCAAGVGAPHIRQRLWFVAVADAAEFGPTWVGRRGQPGHDAAGCGEAGGLGDAERAGREGGVDEDIRRAGRRDQGGLLVKPGSLPLRVAANDGRGTPWSDADWIFCRDGKYRPVEPGSFPLAHGSPARMGRLRGYGNGIVAAAAQAFIEATGLI